MSSMPGYGNVGFTPRVVTPETAIHPRLSELVNWLEANAKSVDRHEDGVEYRVDLTKKLAQLLVDRTPEHGAEVRQRKLNAARVRRIAADIDAGRSYFNGQSILIGPSGWVLDGQHRGNAVLICDRPHAFLPNVRVIVCKDRTAAKVIDVGAGRSVADIAHMFNGSPLTTQQIAGILCEHFDASNYRRNATSKTYQSEIIDSFDVPEVVGFNAAVLRSGEYAALIRCIRTLKSRGEDPQIAIDFFRSIDQGRSDVNGRHVEALHVYSKWRLKTVRANGLRSTVPTPDHHEQMTRAIQIWNVYRSGKSVRSMPKYHSPATTGKYAIPEAV